MGIAGSAACRNIDMNESGLNHTVVGTARYMSPERLFDKAYGPPSDIWSFGLVLFECSNGGQNPLSFEKDDDKLKKERRHRKHLQSLVEFAIALEDFNIEQSLERLSLQAERQCGDTVNWKLEKNQTGGIAELLRLCLQTEPGECNYK